MICPNCKKEIDLPFEVEVCPHCNFSITELNREQLEDSVVVTSNPFIENNISYPVLANNTKYLDKYKVNEFLGNYYPFSYYSVTYNEKKFILQISRISPLDSSEIEKKLKKEFDNLEESNIDENIAIIEYGLKNGNIFFLLEYFTLETVQDVLNTTTNLSNEYTLNLILFLSKWHEKSSKPHIFLSPSNIVSLGNNQFKVFNYKTIKILSNFIKPFFYFQENTSKYLAPELLKGDRLITKKADIFSIGKIWEALINTNFTISDKQETEIEKQIKKIIITMTQINYENRKFNKESIKEIIENYLNIKSNNDFTTQKILLNDIILDEITLPNNIEKEQINKSFEKLEMQNIEALETNEEEKIKPTEKNNKIEDLETIDEDIKIEEIEEIKAIEKNNKIEDLETVDEDIKIEEIKPTEKNNKIEKLETIDEDIKLEEIEPEIIIKKVDPPTIPIAPPSLNIKKVTEKEFKIAKKQLNKNPIDLNNLKTLYSYYSDKEMIDEAFIVSNLLNFMNDKTNSHLLFKSGKNVNWDFNKSILTKNNLQKILPQKIYFNTSGVMQVLYNTLQDNLQIIKTIAPLSNYSILINDPEKKEIVKNLLILSGLKNLKISLTNQDIYNEKSVSTAIYKRDEFIHIIIKKDLCENMENMQFKVLLSKLIFLAHSNIVGNFLYDVQTVKDIFYGVMKFVIPSSRNMYNSKVSNILFKELERQKALKKLKRMDTLRLVILMNEHLYTRKAQPDINESMKLIEMASDRFALIVSNNLNETLKTFLNYESVNIKLSASERMKYLLKYVLSEEYFQLRKDIKQSIKA